MPTRREFLGTAALAAAGLPFLGCKHEPGPPLPEDQRLGFALVGLGSLSTNQIAPALQKTAYCRLAAVVTGHPDTKGVQWRARYGLAESAVYTYDTMNRLGNDRNVDVVYVVTPNALHAEHTIKGLQAGKHVLCEKPMEVSVERCQAMIDAARTANRQLAIGYRCHFEPHHREAVRLAREKELGALQRIDASFGFTIGDPTQWRLRKALAGGGPLMDVGIYALQTTRMLTGAEPTSIAAQTTTTDPVKFAEVEENIAFQLAFPGGVTASCGASYAQNSNQFTAHAANGSFGMAPAYNDTGNHGWRSDGRPLSFPEIDQFAAEMDDFAHCITTGTPTSVPGEEGLRDVRIMMAAYESARTGQAVQL